MIAFELNNTLIHYRVSGNGNPVVLLHGFLEDSSMWETITPFLIELGFCVYAIDLPCHGKSRFQGEICTMKQMAEVVTDFCKKQQLDNPFIIGHSMGGYVGLEILKLFSARLILLHSNFWEDPPQKKKDRNRVVEIVKRNKMRLIQESIPYLFTDKNREKCQISIEQLIKKAGQIPANEIIASTRGMRDRKQNIALLKQYEITIIQGELDPIIKQNTMKKLLDELETNTTLYTIKNCGHMSIWESTAQLKYYLKVALFR